MMQSYFNGRTMVTRPYRKKAQKGGAIMPVIQEMPVLLKKPEMLDKKALRSRLASEISRSL